MHTILKQIRLNNSCGEKELRDRISLQANSNRDFQLSTSGPVICTTHLTRARNVWSLVNSPKNHCYENYSNTRPPIIYAVETTCYSNARPIFEVLALPSIFQLRRQNTKKIKRNVLINNFIACCKRHGCPFFTQ